MTEHYVTLFDRFYLPQGLALHSSMQRHCGDFTLWVLCMDQEVHTLLSCLDLPQVRLLQLSDWETPELLAVKPGRTRGEYCWTLTPFSVQFVFSSDPEVARVTYVDADTWFLSSPKPIFDELRQSGKAVLITEHAYAPEHDQTATFGRYCVQFMCFERVSGEAVRAWWELRCLEWCFARHEDGKFGDQKYLDDWEVRFRDQVHVLRNQALTMGPWNASRFPYSAAVVWHFHKVRLDIRAGRVRRMWGGDYPLPGPTRRHVYEPYFVDLRHQVERLLQGISYCAPSQHYPSLFMRFAYMLRGWGRSLWRYQFGVYWR
jgi:hypothetical protein